MVSFTHVIKSPLFSDVLSRQTHIHHTGRFYFFQISCSIGMLICFYYLSSKNGYAVTGISVIPYTIFPYVGIIQIRSMGQGTFSLLSAGSCTGSPFWFIYSIHYTTSETFCKFILIFLSNLAFRGFLFLFFSSG